MYCYRALRNHVGQGQAPQCDQQGPLGMKHAEIEQFTLYDTSIESACAGASASCICQSCNAHDPQFQVCSPYVVYCSAYRKSCDLRWGDLTWGAIRETSPQTAVGSHTTTRGSLHVVDATAESSATSTSSKSQVQ